MTVDDRPTAESRALPLLLILFVGSGCAALNYEIVWYQLLQLVIRASAVSLGVLLATFMGGLCLGSMALPGIVGELQQRLDRPDYAGVAQSLRDVGSDSAVEILRTYAGQASDLNPWLYGADINRDRNLRLQYLAGMAVDDNREGVINAEMMVFGRFPANLFVGFDQDVNALRLRPGWR